MILVDKTEKPDVKIMNKQLHFNRLFLESFIANPDIELSEDPNLRQRSLFLQKVNSGKVKSRYFDWELYKRKGERFQGEKE